MFSSHCIRLNVKHNCKRPSSDPIYCVRIVRKISSCDLYREGTISCEDVPLIAQAFLLVALIG